MPSTTAVSFAVVRITRPRLRGVAPVALAAALLVGGTRSADAQATAPQATTSQNAAAAQAAGERTPRWSFQLPTGTVVPTCTQRDAIKRGYMDAAQLSYLVRPDLAITATFGWARSRDVRSIGQPKVDLFTYDLGAEARARQWRSGRAIAFRPFAGGGAGARSYNYRKLDVDATHNVAAYLSAGGELDILRLRLRLEARDYVTGFKPLSGVGTADMRNDVVVMLGLDFVRR